MSSIMQALSTANPKTYWEVVASVFLILSFIMVIYSFIVGDPLFIMMRTRRTQLSFLCAFVICFFVSSLLYFFL